MLGVVAAVAATRARRPAPAARPGPAWFDAPVPADTATPPMGIPTSAPGRARSGAPAVLAGAPAWSAEATDPGLRLPVPADPRRAGHGSAEATDRLPVAALAAAPPVPPPGPPAGFAPWPAPPVPPAAPEPAPRPAHRWGLGAYLVAELVFLGVSGLMGLLLVGQDPIAAGALAAALGVPTVAAAGVALLWTRWRGNGPVVDLHLRPTWKDLWLGLGFGFGGLFLTLPASLVYVSIVGEDASSAVGDVFGGITAPPLTALAIVAIVVLVAPLCEEILYRGLLWGGLTRLGANRWLAFGVTTVIFALAHFEWPRALLLLVVALPLGLARVYSDGLLAPVIAHQVNNLLPGIGLYLMLTGAFPVL